MVIYHKIRPGNCFRAADPIPQSDRRNLAHELMLGGDGRAKAPDEFLVGNKRAQHGDRTPRQALNPIKE